MRERSTQRWSPECHLIVRLPASRIDATSGTEQRNPETEGERRYDSGWTWCLAGTCRLRFGVGKAFSTCRVESSRRVVVPGRAVTLGEPPVHGVPQCDLQPLQRSVERRAHRRVPRVQVEGRRPVAPRSLEVRAQALGRERRLQFVQDVLVPGEGVDFSPLSRYGHVVQPGSASAFGYAPGVQSSPVNPNGVRSAVTGAITPAWRALSGWLWPVPLRHGTLVPVS